MYTPKYVTEYDVRHFFTTPIDYTDLGTAELLLKIEAVEDFVEAVYFKDSTTTAENVRIPCLLLIIAKIIANPTLAKTYGTLSKEVLGDYAYELAQTSRMSQGASPNMIAKSWEQMALDMLEARSEIAKNRMKFGLWKAND